MHSMNQSANPRRLLGVPRLKHKKSKTGCLRCKERRVKVGSVLGFHHVNLPATCPQCDEVRPTCTKCARHQLDCDYPPKTQFVHHTGPIQRSKQRHHSTTVEQDATEILPPLPLENGSTLSLRLYRTYCYDIAEQWAYTDDVNVEGYHGIWTHDVPLLALDHPNLMNALLSFSASFLLRKAAKHTRSSDSPDESYPRPGSLTAPTEPQLIQARDHYWSLALSAQNAAASNLTNRNGDAVLLTSIMIAHNAFAMLRDRHTTDFAKQSYEPPSTWLALEFGALTIWPHTSHHSAVSRILQNTAPAVSADHVFTEESRAVYSSVLLADCRISERLVYENAVLFLGYVKNQLDIGRSGYAMMKPMAMFGLLVGRDFVEKVTLGEQRALVVLGIFFGIWEVMKRPPWWAECVGSGEIPGILSSLDSHWRAVLESALKDLHFQIAPQT